jgi:hypothetical protein
MCVGLVVKTRIGREVPCLDVPLAKIDAVERALGGQSTVLLCRLGLVAGMERGFERRGKRGGEWASSSCTVAGVPSECARLGPAVYRAIGSHEYLEQKIGFRRTRFLFFARAG